MRAPKFLCGSPGRLPGSRSPETPRRIRPGEGGFTLTEVVVAMAVSIILGVVVVLSLLSAQKFAASTRVATDARVILQRNIDTALGVKFTSVDTPGILAITGSDGEVYNGEGVGSPTSIPIITTSGSNTLVSGTLTRIVTAYSNSEFAVIRKVTFRLDYEFQGRSTSVSMSTLRSQDDQ